MRCAWCEREWSLLGVVAACRAHERLLDDLAEVRWGLAARAGDFGADSMREVQRFDAAVADRDARELRGELIDWSRPVEGWALF